jgi:hypothetical protein
MSMEIPPLRSLAILACLLAGPVLATSEYHYGRNEYVIIQDGLAPNKRLSIAAHGAGEGGGDDFHVWLMAEPAHKRLAILDNVSDTDDGHAAAYLDSGADAYTAVWAPDSRHVAVSFRTSRHMLRLNVYAVDGSRAALIRGPSLLHEVIGREITDDDDFNDYRSRNFELTWRGADRFTLTEHRLFQTKDPAFAGRLGRYSKELKTTTDDGYRLVVFAAEAECQLIPGSGYKVVDLNVGKFDGYDE